MSARSESKKHSNTWSAEATEHSDALDLQNNVFQLNDPKRIARSLKRSALASRRRKSSPFRSAMSMLTFYINRAGTNLSRRAQAQTSGREGRTSQSVRSRNLNARQTSAILFFAGHGENSPSIRVSELRSRHAALARPMRRLRRVEHDRRRKPVGDRIDRRRPRARAVGSHSDLRPLLVMRMRRRGRVRASASWIASREAASYQAPSFCLAASPELENRLC